MDKRELEHFIAIAEEENISKAAKKLNIAQPHLSRQLRQLEEELGVDLFERRKKKLYLTDAGRYLLNRGYEITRLMDQTVGEMRQIRNATRGTLSIGMLESVSVSFLPGWIAEYRGENPEIMLHTWSAGTSAELLERLNKGLLEIAFVKEPVSMALYQHVVLDAEPWVVLFPRSSSLAEQTGPVTQAELADLPLLLPANNLQTGDIIRWLNAWGISPWLSATWTTLTSAIFLMKAAQGVVICPISGIQLIDQDTFGYREIQFGKEDYRWVMVWNKFDSCTPNMEKFINLVRRKAKQGQQSEAADT
ncbi:LysR family transcriptional regulator [Oscillibacter hominis]|uniref:LysR family transcriptional regulator n=1 Tax=Oscillibacter hominis TaxID=2763056 RepID=A0A7G9B4S0_9FIRM|nr:LysR family transcriptional regulator [Oscillibacter hominis]QNL44551.1 LysR family transcriptional regulator [Oscillibacter hominis]